MPPETETPHAYTKISLNDVEDAAVPNGGARACLSDRGGRGRGGRWWPAEANASTAQRSLSR